ncbi:hypothetical protein [Streptomyces acidiscabies]|uniref:Uncharacterized protein n=1 Tax=Streptomyces acidiscabies TaxID=42234 RepID=A0AAP6BD08_9ACTN|nr:hypothetical protein [Streptomyces acidiscabies]MBZ3909437.1 hypothetical protein [Streptomyces acidiscabies]MDX2962395.1 hypothetical protein [Streptomyces acidiscabies]MDX3792414.1 hypothetical protein [Streptomyces acidiscabies]
MKHKLPDAASLPRDRYSGWACVWCGARFLPHTLAVSAGRAEGRIARIDLSVEVFQCPPGFGCAINELEGDIP